MKTLLNKLAYIEVLQQIMQDNHYSQKAIGDIIGVNQTTVSQWLLGRKKPSYDNIISICEHFNVSPNNLFGVD